MATAKLEQRHLKIAGLGSKDPLAGESSLVQRKQGETEQEKNTLPVVSSGRDLQAETVLNLVRLKITLLGLRM
jgi:hypothetical protein